MAVALDMRRGEGRNDLLDRLAADGRLRLSSAEIADLVADRAAFIGAAGAQLRSVVARIEEIAAIPVRRGQLHPGRHPVTGVLSDSRR